jgi:hypothetical protein
MFGGWNDGGSTKIKIKPRLTQLVMRDTITETSGIHIKILPIAVALLTLGIIYLPTVSIQSSLGQVQQQPVSGSTDGNATEAINVENLTSHFQQAVRSANETEFSTYVSPELGLRIEHPSNWSPIVKEFDGDVQVLEFNATRSAIMQLLPPTVSISSAPQPDIQNLSQLTESLLAIAGSYPGFDLKENTTTTLGNVTAQKVLYTYGSGDPTQQFILQSMDVWTLNDGKRYVFSYVAPIPEFPINLELVEQMIRSISFQ